MLLTDLEYFAKKQSFTPAHYNVAERGFNYAQEDASDGEEFERRLTYLSHIKGNEHIRQCSDFMAEIITFVVLHEAGADVHWVPQSGQPMPDLRVASKPVEIKHINSPREEHEALANGEMVGGSVDMNYDQGLDKKIADKIAQADRQFASFNKETGNTLGNVLFLYFSKGLDAIVTDANPYATKMKDRVLAKATPLISSDVELHVLDIDEQV